ncbi:MAG: hypothetical protein OJF52_001230 [Nitrospira sp.]|nr:MAG: hypothetical protein OJF52_001230 [Nitrospira sp.]
MARAPLGVFHEKENRKHSLASNSCATTNRSEVILNYLSGIAQRSSVRIPAG